MHTLLVIQLVGQAENYRKGCAEFVSNIREECRTHILDAVQGIDFFLSYARYIY